MLRAPLKIYAALSLLWINISLGSELELKQESKDDQIQEGFTVISGNKIDLSNSDSDLFHHRKFDLQHLQLLCDALQKSTTQVLDLNHSPLRNQGVAAIAKTLETNTSLTSLNLSHTNIGDEGLTALEHALQKNFYLTNLVLSNNHIDDVGLCKFLPALKVNTSLRSLDLSKNCFSGNILTILAKLLSQNTTLQELNLSRSFARISTSNTDSENGVKSNMSLSGPVVTSYITLLFGNTLNKLTSYFKTQDPLTEGVSFFSHMLASNSTLIKLDLTDHPNIAPEIFSPIANSFKSREVLAIDYDTLAGTISKFGFTCDDKDMSGKSFGNIHTLKICNWSELQNPNFNWEAVKQIIPHIKTLEILFDKRKPRTNMNTSFRSFLQSIPKGFTKEIKAYDIPVSLVDTAPESVELLEIYGEPLDIKTGITLNLSNISHKIEIYAQYAKKIVDNTKILNKKSSLKFIQCKDA